MVQLAIIGAAKNNLYSVLGDLVKDLNGPELDLLFSHLRPAPGH